MFPRSLLVGMALLISAFAWPAEGPGGASAAQANRAPRIAAMDARIGRIYEEGRGPRNGGLRLRYTLCDDGPQNVSGRYATIRLTHRWGTRSAESLLVRETSDLITYDVYFSRPECVPGISWDNATPLYLSISKTYPCYAVTLRVRDPAGLWSKPRTRVVRRCVPGP